MPESVRGLIDTRPAQADRGAASSVEELEATFLSHGHGRRSQEGSHDFDVAIRLTTSTQRLNKS